MNDNNYCLLIDERKIDSSTLQTPRFKKPMLSEYTFQISKENK